MLEWAHVCDAGIAVLNKNGKIKLKKDGCASYFQWPHDAGRYDFATWEFINRTIARNAVSARGKLLGYGVVTGEPEALRYVESGSFRLAVSDTVVLYTDGFTPYFSLASFRNVIAHVSSHILLQKKIVDLARQYQKKEGWNREKSLIVIKV